MPEEVGEAGPDKALGENSGLRTTLTGRCAAFRNVDIVQKRNRSMLRRMQPTNIIERASLNSSVQGDSAMIPSYRVPSGAIFRYLSSCGGYSH